MARIKTQGWYTFEDGTRSWYHGLSKNERMWEESRHGKVVKFVPTYY